MKLLNAFLDGIGKAINAAFEPPFWTTPEHKKRTAQHNQYLDSVASRV